MQVECNGLQKECSVLRSEKQETVNKHQRERSSLQTECESLRAEKEELLKNYQKEKGNLQSECAALRSEKEAVLQNQKQLEKDLTRSVHWATLSRAPTFTLPVSLFAWLCSNMFCTTHLSRCHLSPIELSVVLCLVVRVPRILSWAIASKLWRDPSRSWRRGWPTCSSSTSRIAPSCKPSWKKQTVTARLCREKYVLKTQRPLTKVSSTS